MAIRLAGEIELSSTPGESELYLKDLQDVTITGPTTKDFLAWNGSIQEWENRPITIADLEVTGVAAGSYNSVTVNEQGLITAATTIPYLTGNQNITLSGDASGTGTTSIALTLANTGVSAGTYGSSSQTAVITVDSKGRITSATTTNIPLASSVVNGLMVSADKQKLDTVRANSAPNQNIISGNGLVGGSAEDEITIDIVPGDGINVSPDAITVDNTVLRTTGGQTISGDLAISGDLTVGGSSFEPGNVALASPFANLNYDDSGGPGSDLPVAANSGLIIHRGGTVGDGLPTVGFQWNESTNEWEVQGSPGGTFRKLWHNGNMGTGTGLDADLLDGQEGTFYQDASNLVSGTLTEGRLPAFVGGDVSSSAGSAILTLQNTGVTAGSYGTGVEVPTITVDGKGRIVSAGKAAIPTVTTSQTGMMTSSDKIKLDGVTPGAQPNQDIQAGSGLIGGGSGAITTLNVGQGAGITVSAGAVAHADTSSQNTVTNLNGNVIQSVELDTFGHVTGLDTLNLDDRYFTETEVDETYAKKVDTAPNSTLLNGQTGAYYTNASNLDSGILPGARFSDASHGNRSGGSLHAEATTATAGFLSAADKAKLDGVRTNSDPNQNIIAGDGLTGGGSTDAVTLNVDGTVLRVNEGGLQSILGDITILGNLTVNGNTDVVQRDISTGENTILLNADWPDATSPTESGGIFLYRGDSDNTVGFVFDEADDTWKIQERSGVNPSDPGFPATGGGTEVSSYNIWHAGNMGAGSGLDADTVDGQQAADLLALSNATGTLPASRFNDTSHGSRSGGTSHTAVTTSVNGFMSAADKSKLDGISSGSKPNQNVVAGNGLTGGGTGATTTLNAVAGDGIEVTANAISHADTSSQSSVNNSGGTVIQDITLDEFGHISAIGSVNLDGRYYTEAQSDARFLGLTATADNSALLNGEDGAHYLSLSNATGTLPSARFNDASHGTRSGGNLHADATTSSSGFLSATDKVKLNSVASNAKANQTIVSGNGLTGGSANNTVTLNIVGGDGITANADNITVDNSVIRTSGGTMANLTITGDLNVTGTTTIGTVESVSSTDPHIVLNTDFSGATPTEDQGLIARRGTQYNAALFWDESTDSWSIGRTTALNLSAPTNISKIWHAGNDGAGSGLDADLLDGQSSAYYARSARSVLSGTGLTGGGNLTADRTLSLDTTYTDTLYLGIGAKASDADKLDGINSSSFLRSDASDIKNSGNLRFNDGIRLNFGSSEDAGFYCNGSHMYTDLGEGIGNWIIRDGTTTKFTLDDAGHFTATGNITAGGTVQGAIVKTDRIDNATGNQLVLNVGESAGNASGQTGELLYVNAESGMQISCSPDNWASGWAGKITHTIGAASVSFGAGVSAPSFNTTSSARYKYDIKETPKEMATSLMKLRPVNYKRKATGKSENGFIAEDVVGVYPELVALNKQGQVESIDYSKLVVPLVATTQQHDKKLEEAVKTIDRLEGVNRTNRQKIASQQKSINKLERTLDTIQSREVTAQLSKGKKLDEAELLKLELRALRDWKAGFESTFNGLKETVAKSESIVNTLLKEKDERDAEIAKLKKDLKAKEKAKPKAKAEPKSSKLDFNIKKDKK